MRSLLESFWRAICGWTGHGARYSVPGHWQYNPDVGEVRIISWRCRTCHQFLMQSAEVRGAL